MPELRITEGPHTGDVFRLNRESAVLGRDPECDIVFYSGSVSRQHAKILRIDEAFFIEDLQSRNGTYVNNSRIRQREQLSDQDRITLCDVVLVFNDDAPAGLARPRHGGDLQDDFRPRHGADRH